METINVQPAMNQSAHIQKPKNYFVIALVITIIAYVSDFLYGFLGSLIVPLFDYEVSEILSSVMRLFNIALCSCIVYFGFYLWSKNKLAAFRFTGIYYFVIWFIDELLALISEVYYCVFAARGNYSVYNIATVITGFMLSLITIISVPLIYNILNKRTTNYTVYPQQKGKVIGIAVASLFVYSLVPLAYVIFSIYNSVTTYSRDSAYLIHCIASFMLTIVAVTVCALLAYSFRKDAKDIIAILSLVFFPRVIINVVVNFTNGVVNIISIFTSIGVLWIIFSVLMVLFTVGISIPVICFTATKFFPVVNPSLAQNSYSPITQCAFAGVQSFSPVSPVEPATSSGSVAEASPLESLYEKAGIDKNNSCDDCDPTIRE